MEGCIVNNNKNVFTCICAGSVLPPSHMDSVFLCACVRVCVCVCVCVCVWSSEPQEPAQKQLRSLEQELQQQTVQLRQWQMKALLELRREQHALESDRKHTHLQEVSGSESEPEYTVFQPITDRGAGVVGSSK